MDLMDGRRVVLVLAGGRRVDEAVMWYGPRVRLATVAIPERRRRRRRPCHCYDDDTDSE